MHDHQEELDSYRRMLREIADLAEHASLTGAYGNDSGRAIERYNSILARLIEIGAVPNLFTALPSNASFASLAVDARLVCSSLNGKHKGKSGVDNSLLMRLAPFVDSADLSAMIREQMSQDKSFDMSILANLAPFMEKGMLGDLIRRNLSGEPNEPSPEPKPAPAPAPQPERDIRPQVQSDHQSPRTEDLLELLKNPHLSEDERRDLVDQLARSVRTDG